MISMKNCKGFHVLDFEFFNAIRWEDHVKFLREEYLTDALERLKHSTVAHVWNRHTAATPLNINDNVAYIHLAKKFCPKVIESSELF